MPAYKWIDVTAGGIDFRLSLLKPLIEERCQGKQKKCKKNFTFVGNVLMILASI